MRARGRKGSPSGASDPPLTGDAGGGHSKSSSLFGAPRSVIASAADAPAMVLDARSPDRVHDTRWFVGPWTNRDTKHPDRRSLAAANQSGHHRRLKAWEQTSTLVIRREDKSRTLPKRPNLDRLFRLDTPRDTLSPVARTATIAARSRIVPFRGVECLLRLARRGEGSRPMPLTITDAVARLKGVFLDVPGTRLSVDDASRLTGLERETCLLVLTALEDAHYLARVRHGLFVRRSSDSPMV
jgi:hypothetical protein